MNTICRFILIYVFAVFSMAVSADDGTDYSCGEHATWSLEDKDGSMTLVISGYGPMTDFTNSDDIPWYNKYHKKIKHVVISNGITTIGEKAFMYSSNLESVSIPSTVTKIGYAAFRNCHVLTTVDIPSSVTYIGTWAFLACIKLSLKQIPNSVTYIGTEAFEACESLVTINIPNQITWVSQGCFSKCSRLESVYIPNTVRTIYNSAFQKCTSLKSVTLPNSITTLGAYIFSKCSSLESVKLPDHVGNIGNYDFEECANLRSIDIPKTVTTIGPGAFRGCKSLTSVDFSDNIRYIGGGAFAKCYGLTSVTIPRAVDTLKAFHSCIGLRSIYVSWNRPITDASWTGLKTDSCVLYVPRGRSELYRAIEAWNTFKYIEEYDAEPFYPRLTVKYDDTTLAVEKLEDGGSYEIVVPKGYDKVFLNGADVTDQVADDGTYVTPPITKNTTLSVKFNHNRLDNNGDGVVDSQDVLNVYEYMEDK